MDVSTMVAAERPGHAYDAPEPEVRYTMEAVVRWAEESGDGDEEHGMYAMIEGKQAGPFSEQELARLIAEKKVLKETYIWMPSLPSWKMAEQVPEVLKLVALAPPPFQQNK